MKRSTFTKCIKKSQINISLSTPLQWRAPYNLMPNWCCLYCYPQRHLLSHIFHFTLNSQTCKMSSAHTFALGHISCYPSVLRVSHSLMQHAICATCVADESINYLRTESACTGWLTFRQTATRRSYLCKEHRSHRAVTSRVT